MSVMSRPPPTRNPELCAGLLTGVLTQVLIQVLTHVLTHVRSPVALWRPELLFRPGQLPQIDVRVRSES